MAFTTRIEELDDRIIFYDDNLLGLNGNDEIRLAELYLKKETDDDGNEFHRIWCYYPKIEPLADFGRDEPLDFAIENHPSVASKNLPVGSIIPWSPYRNTGNIPEDFIECNGAGVDPDDYKALAAIRGLTGGLVNVPDLRNYYLRGYDPDGVRDPDGGPSGRTVMSTQNGAIESHNHSVNANPGNYNYFANAGPCPNANRRMRGGGTTTSTAIEVSGGGGFLHGSEMHPRHKYVKFIMRARNPIYLVENTLEPDVKPTVRIKVEDFIAEGLDTQTVGVRYLFYKSDVVDPDTPVASIHFNPETNYLCVQDMRVTNVNSTEYGPIDMTPHWEAEPTNGVPIGSIVAWPENAKIPAGYEKCELGNSVPKYSRGKNSEYRVLTYLLSPYQNLFTVGVSSPSEDNLYLPDLRGYFLRGDNMGSGNDPDGNRASLYTEQLDEFRQHRHRFDRVDRNGAESSAAWNNHDIWTNAAVNSSDWGGASETRPDNIAVVYLMKTRELIDDDQGFHLSEEELNPDYRDPFSI